MKLLLKFNLILLAIFSTCGLAIALVARGYLVESAREEVEVQERLMMAGAAAVRDYIATDVSPLLEQNPRHRVHFLAETVPFYGATTTFARLRREYPDYSYKETALNPTNPEDRASSWQVDVIDWLRDHPDQSERTGQRETPMGPALFLARPIHATKDCLECHSSTSVAPKALVAVYGPANGFGWKLNEIVGAQIVSVPLSVPAEKAERAFHRLLLFLVLTVLATMAALDAGVYWFVIRPLRLVSDSADRVSRGEKNVPPVQIEGRDEIATVAASFNRMQVSLQKALRMFDQD